jgi:single-stranded-DNA-specific exonuclease
VDNGLQQTSGSIIQGVKYVWLFRGSESSDVLQLASRYNLSMPIVQTLIGRGFASREAIDSFLFASFESDVSDPALLADAQKVVARLRCAIDAGHRILIFGDYDVDGMSATALVMYCLLTLGAKVNFYLPNRMTEGYGLSVDAIKKAAHNGYAVVLTVDNGITAFEPACVAKKLGIDLIITDHHRPLSTLPDAYAVINPQRADCTYPYKVLAGVGVAFKVMSLLFQEYKKQLPDKVYELLALGTIADVVPLTGENRFWVRYGMAHINRSMSLPLRVLKQNNNITKESLTALDIGFSIAPQLNALGRLSDPRKAISFLIGADSEMVKDVGQLLFELNESRKQVERSILYDVESAIRERRIDLARENIIMAAHKSWPAGVIGLVASRFVSQYGRPSLLFHYSEDGRAKGSGRSIPGFNLFEALEANADILDTYGGHAAAAGLSLAIDKVPVLKERLEERIRTLLTPFDLQQKLVLDATVQLSELTRKFIDDMAHLEPFGQENQPPLFYVKQVMQVQKPTLLKDKHVKCYICADGVVKPLIFFNRPELFDVMQTLDDKPFDCAVYVTENVWNGRTNIELQGLDIAIGK